MRAGGKEARNLILIVAFAVLVVAIAPWLGTQPLSWSDVFGPDASLGADVFWKLRLPRIATGFLAGCGLALGGTAFQAVFRNPLAEPFILGVSSGASAGAALALFLGGGAALAGWLAWENAFAFAGAFAAVLVVHALTRLRGGNSPAQALLAGVAVNFFFSSLVMLMQHLSDPANAARMFRAMIGGIAAANQRQLLVALPFLAVGALVVMMRRRELDLLSLGEEEALTRGVDTAGTRKTLFLAVSVMVGAITALCGPIGFVGLLAPHICRRLVGPGHGRLLPASALFGGAFLVAADLAARMVIAPAELPVGVISSLCGAPFFLWLLMRRTGQK